MDLKARLFRLLYGTMHLNYGRDIVLSWVKESIRSSPGGAVKILDIGTGRGDDLLNIGDACGREKVELHGIECYPANARLAESRGIRVYEMDVERDRIPTGDGSFDVVIANQIVEHAKEIFWVFSEISRVLKKDGICIVGVPNLAALHNRILLLFGSQPTCIELLGPHVRGFTKPGFEEFATCGGYFDLLRMRGANFYPFPPAVSGPLSRLFPKLSVCLFFLLRRTAKEGRFIEVLDTRFYETPYYRGEKGDAGGSGS